MFGRCVNGLAAARWLDDHRKWELDKARCSLGNRRG